MKTLKIYKEDGEFVIERSDESKRHIRKRYFLDEKDLEDALIAYSYVIDNYKIETTNEVHEIVKKYLQIP